MNLFFSELLLQVISNRSLSNCYCSLAVFLWVLGRPLSPPPPTPPHFPFSQIIGVSSCFFSSFSLLSSYSDCGTLRSFGTHVAHATCWIPFSLHPHCHISPFHFSSGQIRIPSFSPDSVLFRFRVEGVLSSLFECRSILPHRSETCFCLGR